MGGRPRKLSSREERKILRTSYSLRHEEGNFTSIRLMTRAGISPKHVSNRTIRRFLQRKGYHFVQARKKGLLSEKDLKERLQFAKHMQKDYSKDVWKDDVAFYLDCVSFGIKGTQQIKPVRLTAVFGVRSARDVCAAALQREANWEVVEKL